MKDCKEWNYPSFSYVVAFILCSFSLVKFLVMGNAFFVKRAYVIFLTHWFILDYHRCICCPNESMLEDDSSTKCPDTTHRSVETDPTGKSTGKEHLRTENTTKQG